ncbi:RING-type E3 ubiquitin transferase [Theileria orientalis]|uniref:RING-type E3 ubiquitin transferase n=1 Tax=Theileria orientalis TaxID=68886 RepID=A0A976SLF8_THEOR|nr:RING-type E3 ubiquitin transferase [Theileria orientalis]
MSQVNDPMYVVPSPRTDNVRGQVLSDPISYSNTTEEYSNNVPGSYNNPILLDGGLGLPNIGTPDTLSSVEHSTVEPLPGRPSASPTAGNSVPGRTNSLPNTTNIGVNNALIHGANGARRGTTNSNNNLGDIPSPYRFRPQTRQSSIPPRNNRHLIANRSELLRLQQELTRYHASIHPALCNSPRFANQNQRVNRGQGLSSPNSNPNVNLPFIHQGVGGSPTAVNAGENLFGIDFNASFPPSGVGIENICISDGRPIMASEPTYGFNYFDRIYNDNTQFFTTHAGIRNFIPSPRTTGRSSEPSSCITSSMPSNRTSSRTSSRNTSRNSSPRQNQYFMRSPVNTFAMRSNSTNYFVPTGSHVLNSLGSNINFLTMPTRSINMMEPVEIRLPPELIESFPVNNYTINSNDVDDNSKTCSVCLEEYHEGVEIKRLPCTHFYHKNCIDLWLNKSTICPICKFDFIVMLQF